VSGRVAIMDKCVLFTLREVDVSHKPEKTLEQIFAHPISMNMHWKDIVHLFEHAGGSVEVVHGGREKVMLNGLEHTFHIPHTKTLESKDEVVAIRKFLEEAGVRPGE